MLQRNDSGTLVVWTLGCMLFSATAFAQDANPELGDTGGSVGVQADTSSGAQGTWQPPATAADTLSNDTAAGGTDHSLFVGRFGVGFFGVQSIPVGDCSTVPGGCPTGVADIAAPTIGIRYWLQEGLGIEAALGFNISSGGGETTTGPTTTEFDDPGYVAFALHGGLPLVFATSQHFNFQVVPELNFGIASGSWEAPNADEISVSGLLFQLGARVGGEVHFGFIDIPQLALQATVGAHLSVQSRSATYSPSAGGGDSEASRSTFGFGTTVQGEPWDIFTGNISAIYYF